MPFTGLLETGFMYRRFAEDVRPDRPRLGRHQWLDGRSLAHMVENDVREMGKPLGSQRWKRRIPILDQGTLGSCTGNAGTGALGTEPFYDAVGKPALPQGDGTETLEAFAVQLYSEATHVDGVPGDYPSEDTGSSGLAICKVLRTRRTITGYRWARSPYGLLRLLQSGPVLQGMPWHEAFFEPDGLHLVAAGVELDERDAFSSAIIYANSWGTGWGLDGYFKMRLRTYEQLSSVDLKQFVV